MQKNLKKLIDFSKKHQKITVIITRGEKWSYSSKQRIEVVECSAKKNLKI